MRNMKRALVALGATVFLGVGGAAGSLQRGADLKPLVERYWKLWQSGPAAAAELYAKDPDLVFFDLEPLKYTGWDEYRAGVGPHILSKFSAVAFKVNPDVKTTVRGNVAWTSATVNADGTLKASGPIHVVIRHTAIWETRGQDWLIVHEHVSVHTMKPPNS
jgi:ketosteroid isomerase-like protein